MKKLIMATAVIALGTSIFAFDAQKFKPNGNISSYTKTDYNVTSKFGDYFRTIEAKHVHVYDSTGLELTSSTYSAKDSLTDKVNYKYDTSRNLVEIVYLDGGENPVWSTKYEYQSDGKIKSESEFNTENTLTSKTIYKYEGNKITESFYEGSGKLLGRTITILNANEKPEEVFDYFEDGSLTQKTVFAYTEKGKVATAEIYDISGSMVEKEKYVYDNANYLTEIQYYNNKGTLFARKIYKNDTRGNPVKISSYSVAEKFGAIVNELTSITEYAYK